MQRKFEQSKFHVEKKVPVLALSWWGYRSSTKVLLHNMQQNSVQWIVHLLSWLGVAMPGYTDKNKKFSSASQIPQTFKDASQVAHNSHTCTALTTVQLEASPQLSPLAQSSNEVPPKESRFWPFLHSNSWASNSMGLNTSVYSTLT